MKKKRKNNSLKKNKLKDTKSLKKGNEKPSIKNKNIPLGMIFILIIIGLSFIDFITNLKNPEFILGSINFSNTLSLIYVLANIIILLSLFIGIIKKYKWARILGLSYYTVLAVLILINILSIIFNPIIIEELLRQNSNQTFDLTQYKNIISSIIIIMMAIGGIIDLIIIYYLYKKSGYFNI